MYKEKSAYPVPPAFMEIMKTQWRLLSLNCLTAASRFFPANKLENLTMPEGICRRTMHCTIKPDEPESGLGKCSLDEIEKTRKLREDDRMKLVSANISFRGLRY